MSAISTRAAGYDLVVLGGGMGAFSGVAAARKHGIRIALVESGPLGGT